jgi:hypothetical protein
MNLQRKIQKTITLVRSIKLIAENALKETR